ncbi:MAG: hypothetical protein RJB64_696 [Pseudomonadota bacterium]
MNALYRSGSVGLITLATAVLSACGGGGGSGASGNVVSGVAATGLAISGGQVTLKCAAGNAPTVTTQADGSFSIDLSTVTLPCIVRVTYADSNGQHKLHSLAKASGNVNITPITDAVVADLSTTGIASDSFDKFDAMEIRSYSDDRVSTAIQSVKKRLESLGVNTADLPSDVIRSRFSATHGSTKGDRHDAVLDELKARLDEQHKTLKDMEDEMHSGDDSHESSTTTGTPGDASAGQVAYTANCAGCHGTRIPDAVNAAKILNAISENEGGMKVLTSTVTPTMANNIATYMATVINGGTVITKTAQTISFTSPGNQTMGLATPALLATASSGLAVNIQSGTTSVCTVTGTTLSLVAPGNCQLTATQTGNVTYSAAPPVSVNFTVLSAAGTALTSQAITFTSPGVQVMGTNTTLVASSDSGLTVTLASTSPGVCTVSGTTLTPVSAGNCTITANQAGNSSFAAAATVTRTVVVTDPASVTSAANGKLLYTSNNCGMCHGTPPSSMKVLNGANNPTLIRSAINSASGMSGYSSLTDQNLADIAAYLATPLI